MFGGRSSASVSPRFPRELSSSSSVFGARAAMAAAPAKPPGPRDGGWLSRPVLLAVERVARGRAHRVPLVAAGATLVFVAAVMSTMMIGRGEDAPEEACLGTNDDEDYCDDRGDAAPVLVGGEGVGGSARHDDRGNAARVADDAVTRARGELDDAVEVRDMPRHVDAERARRPGDALPAVQRPGGRGGRRRARRGRGCYEAKESRGRPIKNY